MKKYVKYGAYCLMVFVSCCTAAGITELILEDKAECDCERAASEAINVAMDCNQHYDSKPDSITKP